MHLCIAVFVPTIHHSVSDFDSVCRVVRRDEIKSVDFEVAERTGRCGDRPLYISLLGICCPIRVYPELRAVGVRGGCGSGEDHRTAPIVGCEVLPRQEVLSGNPCDDRLRRVLHAEKAAERHTPANDRLVFCERLFQVLQIIRGDLRSVDLLLHILHGRGPLGEHVSRRAHDVAESYRVIGIDIGITYERASGGSVLNRRETILLSRGFGRERRPHIRRLLPSEGDTHGFRSVHPYGYDVLGSALRFKVGRNDVHPLSDPG